MSTSAAGAAAIGRWRFTSAPKNWFYVPDFGLRHNVPDPASNIHLKDDVLLAGDKLAPYVEAQKTMLNRTYDSPLFAGPQPTTLLGDRVDEALLFLIRHQPMHGASVMQVQTYVRVAKWIGIATLTTVDRNLAQVRPDYEQFVASLMIAEEPPPGDAEAVSNP